MLLSGDDLSTMPEPRMAMLKKLLPPTGVAAVFDDEELRVGTMTLPGRRMLGLFNWSDAPQTLSATLTRRSRVTDFWTGAVVPASADRVTISGMPGRSARLLECADA
jgi:alpha-galactosidase